MRTAAAALTLASLALLPAACGEEERAAPAADVPPLVCTTLYPVHYCVARIAGGLANVHSVVDRGADPLHWRPDPETIRSLQVADLIVLNGAEAEKWAFQVSLPASRVVRTADAFADAWVRMEDAITHSHGPGGTHTHEGVDPHTWMDPVNLEAQAESAHTALAALLPGHEAELRSRFRALAADLDALHARFEQLGALPEGEVLLASHPAYNYLARRYGWRVVNLDLDPEQAPGAAEIDAVRGALENGKARFILWESPPVPAWSERLERELDLRGIVFTPCETLPRGDDPDYLTAMTANLERLAPAFR